VRNIEHDELVLCGQSRLSLRLLQGRLVDFAKLYRGMPAYTNDMFCGRRRDPVEDDIANECRALRTSILSEDDARTRMQLCRRALGLGRTAVKTAEVMSEADLVDIQETLRLAFRASRGTYNPNASITKLSQARMARAGFAQLPIISATRPKLISTDTASLAVSSKPLPERWYDAPTALKDMNAARYAVMGVGSDGSYSVCLRLIDATDHFLENPEYKKVIEVSPPMAIKIENESVLFGAPEAIEDGTGLRVANGRYICSVTSLRSGRYLRFIATLIRSQDDIPELHQWPEFREV
jgi:hypothetical protein